jgi:hypothetical protein
MNAPYRALLVAIAIMASSVAAFADPLVANYLVQRKALQKGSVPTSMLTFEVYSDATCTTLVDSQQVAASAVFIEQVKGLRLRGGPAPAKALRLSAALDVDAGAPFLRVTGPGVMPVGAACQLQGASATSILNDNSLTTLVTEVTQIATATPVSPVVDLALATVNGGQPDLDPDRVCFLVENATQGALMGLLTPILGSCSVDFDPVDGWVLHSELSGIADPLGGIMPAEQLCSASCMTWDDGETD